MISRKALLLTLLWILTIACGWYGYATLSPTAPPLSHLYAALQLFGLNGSFADETLPLGIEIARFAAPALTVYTVILAFAGSVLQATRNLRARHLWRGHVIVCGLGAKGLAIASSLLASGKRVVVIDPAPTDAHAQAIDGHPRAVLLRASALDRPALARAGLLRSRHAVVVCGSDACNTEVWSALETEADTTELTVHVHMQDLALARRLELGVDALRSERSPRLRLVNTHQIAVRQLFLRWPLDQIACTHGPATPHLVLVGFGQMGRHILLEALRLYGSEAATPLRISIIDRQAGLAWREFANQHWGIERLCQFTLLEADGLASEALLVRLAPVTAWYVCLDDDSLALREALYLRQHCLRTREANAPVFVRLRDSPGFERLLGPTGNTPRPTGGLLAFGALIDSLNCDVLLDESLDQLARSFHDFYLQLFGQTSVPGPAQQPWDRLGETYRRASRHTADHLGVKLRGIDICLLPSRLQPAAEVSFSAAETLGLAEREHLRWSIERRLEGWQQAAIRVDAARLHPRLQPWSALPDTVRQQNADQMKALPKIARGAGLTLRRQLVVGVTGHRRYTDTGHVRDALLQRLRRIVEAHPEHHLVVLSALAAGADQELAQLALDHFGAELWVVAPFPLELYRGDFADQELAQFEALLGRAARYDEMPLRFGSLAQIAAEPDARNRQYALAGAYVVQRSQQLVALWDGQAAQGVGGTAEVVGWVQAGTVPEPYRFVRLSAKRLPALEIVPVQR